MKLPRPIAQASGILTVIFGMSAAVEAKPISDCNEKLETGMVSWYGEEMAIGKKNGKLIYNPTRSGEKFIPGAISAAHPTLPMGTIVRVERTDNGKSLFVRINDRGPYADDRILDLSRGAAEVLGIKDAGEKMASVFVCKI